MTSCSAMELVKTPTGMLLSSGSVLVRPGSRGEVALTTQILQGIQAVTDKVEAVGNLRFLQRLDRQENVGVIVLNHQDMDRRNAHRLFLWRYGCSLLLHVGYVCSLYDIRKYPTIFSGDIS